MSLTRRDHTYGSAGDATITFSTASPEGVVAAPWGSMHLDLAAKTIYLKVDGRDEFGWVQGSSAGTLPDGNYGDVTVSGGGTSIVINSESVTLDKLVNASGPGIVLGRRSPGTGDYEEVPYALSALTDVTLTSPLADDLLAFDGTKWINRKQTYVTDGGNF